MYIAPAGSLTYFRFLLYMGIGSIHVYWFILKMLVVADASDCQIKKKRSPFLSGLLQVRTLQALKDDCASVLHTSTCTSTCTCIA